MRRLLALAILLCAGPLHAQGPSVVVEALLPNTAVMVINGTRKTLRAGQTHAGVTLVSADSRGAVVEIGGERQALKLHDRVSGSYQAPSTHKVDIPRDGRMQYRTTASINGRAMEVLVDTGANVVAMNSLHAAALGLDFKAGQPARLETAGSVIDAWSITLQHIDVGGIRVENVRATVTEGDFPRIILLGMTYLEHVEMRESNGVLSLSRAW